VDSRKQCEKRASLGHVLESGLSDAEDAKDSQRTQKSQ
jgi:hypothetical protein